MVKILSRRKFLRVVLLTSAAVVVEFLSHKLGKAAALYELQPEIEVAENPQDSLTAVENSQLALDPIGVHHKPSVIYVEG